MHCHGALMSFTVLLVTAVLVVTLAVIAPVPSARKNQDVGGVFTDRPIIGILSQELSSTIEKYYGYHHSYISASYVKLIEGAGARIAPIFIGQSDSYYREMVESVNGVLFPGGATYFDDPDGYGAAGLTLYQEVLRINRLGHYVPLLGICLGMELIAVAAAGGLSKDLRTACDAEQLFTSLTFLPSSNSSRLFKYTPQQVMSSLRNDNITINEHERCVTPENFTSYGLSDDYEIETINEDRHNLTFVSTFESKTMPIYGLQFHPEKYSYEWKKTKHYPHTPEAIQVGRYFADFFVHEARKNNHSFTGKNEREYLIYHYNATDTGTHLEYEQLYFFRNVNASITEN